MKLITLISVLFVATFNVMAATPLKIEVIPGTLADGIEAGELTAKITTFGVVTQADGGKAIVLVGDAAEAALATLGWAGDQAVAAVVLTGEEVEALVKNPLDYIDNMGANVVVTSADLGGAVTDMLVNSYRAGKTEVCNASKATLAWFKAFLSSPLVMTRDTGAEIVATVIATGAEAIGTLTGWARSALDFLGLSWFLAE